MTPAKLVALMDKARDRLEEYEIPIALLRFTYVNAHRNPGNPEKGEAPAPVVPFDELRVFKRKRGSLAAKLEDEEAKPGGKHNYLGAKADRGQFEAYYKGRGKRMRTKRED